ncbi:DCL family protein [Rhodospirillum rubrum]|nr:DCL family protein [Rhodospirillum rubrum]
MHFEKKEDAVAYLHKMLHRYDLGDKVSDDDAIILRAALAHHRDAEVKVGCGITYFSVRTADFGTRCFWLNRNDGTTEKFSHKTCIYST